MSHLSPDNDSMLHGDFDNPVLFSCSALYLVFMATCREATMADSEAA